MVEILKQKDGGKGVISKVLPDEKMPIMIDKASGKQYRVEVVMNPLQFEGGCKIVQNAGTM